MTHMDFAILNNHVVNSYILKIYQKHQFFVVKQKNLNSCVFPCYLSLYITCASFKTRKLLVK